MIFLLLTVPTFLATGNNRKTLVPHFLPLSDEDLRFRGHFWGTSRKQGSSPCLSLIICLHPYILPLQDAPLFPLAGTPKLPTRHCREKLRLGSQWGGETAVEAEGWLLTNQPTPLFCQAHLWLPEACSPHLWASVPGNAFSLNVSEGFLFFHSLIFSSLGI